MPVALGAASQVSLSVSGLIVFLVPVWPRLVGALTAAGALGIVLGSVVDGVPESVILGIQLASGEPISVAFIAAVFVSNIPQAIAPSADLSATGWAGSGSPGCGAGSFSPVA